MLTFRERAAIALLASDQMDTTSQAVEFAQDLAVECSVPCERCGLADPKSLELA